jgi:hypothetical protein
MVRHACRAKPEEELFQPLPAGSLKEEPFAADRPDYSNGQASVNWTTRLVRQKHGTPTPVRKRDSNAVCI